jgi:hypothetical protein
VPFRTICSLMCDGIMKHNGEWDNCLHIFVRPPGMM